MKFAPGVLVLICLTCLTRIGWCQTSYQAGKVVTRVPGQTTQYVIELESAIDKKAVAKILPSNQTLSSQEAWAKGILVRVVEIESGNALVEVIESQGSMPVAGDALYVQGIRPSSLAGQSQSDPNAAYKHGATKGLSSSEERGPSAAQESHLKSSRLSTPLSNRYQETSSTNSGKIMSPSEAFTPDTQRDETGPVRATELHSETTDRTPVSVDEMIRRSRSQSLNSGVTREGKISYIPDTPARLTAEDIDGYTDGDGMICARVKVANRGGTPTSEAKIVIEWKAANGQVVATDLRNLPRLEAGRFLVLDYVSSLRADTSVLTATNHDTTSSEYGRIKPQVNFR
ncbi:MAG: hypothetical protein AB7S38_14950 [Vulcanimicrobiota bacterium]